jgi:hypothetical protein
MAGPGETLSRLEAGPNRSSSRGGAGEESEEASNKPATGLQLAYNFLATPAALRPCYGATPVAVARHDRVPSAETPRACALRTPSRKVVSAGSVPRLILFAFMGC